MNFTPRVCLAIATFYLGVTGFDLLLAGKEQRTLLLIMVGVFLLVPVVITSLGAASGVWPNTMIWYSLLIPLGVGGFWQLARFFEYMWMSEDDFRELMRGKYRGLAT